ncbi:hypothetical protein INR49_007489 [Caranx melampygus]|nr:hypothetical protein INR49_007489 [Caranx melampygus]
MVINPGGWCFKPADEISSDCSQQQMLLFLYKNLRSERSLKLSPRVCPDHQNQRLVCVNSGSSGL